jgi:outer membrane protein, heavy metal efflux system
MLYKLLCAVPRRSRKFSSLVLIVTAVSLGHAAEPFADRRGEQPRSQPAGSSLPDREQATPLVRLVAEALQHNPEIQAARKEREAAAQRISPAGALDDPMLEAGVLNLPTSSFSFNREDMTMKMLGLSQRFPYPGKRELKQNVAQLEAESVGYAYQETVNRVAREARVAYFDLALVIESMRLVQQNRTILEQMLKVAEGRYTVGQGNQVDVFRAQTQLSRMTEELIKLGRERPMLEAELNRVLGRTAAATAPLPVELGLENVPLAFETLQESAFSARPQLLALRSMIRRTERMLELARKEAYPDFDVRFSYGQRDNMPDGTRRSDMINLTVAINLPVWRETKIQPRIAEAQAMHEQALSMYEAQRNETAMKLRQQISTAEQNARAARLYRAEIVPQSRLTVEAAVAAYQVNRSDFALLLDNQMAISNFEIAHAAAIANYNKALAEIDLLTGKAVQ